METTIPFAEAKAHLSALLDRAAAGEEITITRHGKPVARLMPAAPPQRRKPGAWKGVTYDPRLFLEPMTEEELRDAEGDLDEFLDLPAPAPSTGGSGAA